MRSFKSLKTVILAVVAVMLAAALIFSVVVINNKNKIIKAADDAAVSADAKISDAESEIASANEKIKEYEDRLAAEERTNSETQSKLEAAEADKKRLEEEKAALNKKIAELNAKKKQQAAANVSKPASAEPQQTGGKICYLTFDDGPSDNTLKILDILKKYDVKATFFVIKSSKFNYVKNIQEAGHTIGLHTATHDYARVYASTEAYFADLKQISDAVENLTGIKSAIIRFPGGSSNAVSKKYCNGIMSKLVKMVEERGYRYFDWNVSSDDAVSNTPKASLIRDSVLNGAKNKNSICVLMHDAPAKTTTVTALPEIIEGLKKMGFGFAALTEDSYGYHHQNLNN